MMNIAYLSLGSNIGDREAFLKEALVQLHQASKVKIHKLSSIYETDPVGFTEQDAFLNMVVQIETELLPQELLDLCLDIEREMGRVRTIRWGPRVIDIDILLYNKDHIETSTLQIPHPRMHERAFVLVPLAEINPNLILPNFNVPVVDVLDEIPDREGVRLWKQINGEDASAHFGS